MHVLDQTVQHKKSGWVKPSALLFGLNAYIQKTMKQQNKTLGKTRPNPSHWEVWKQNALDISAKCELQSEMKGVYHRQRNLNVVFCL